MSIALLALALAAPDTELVPLGSWMRGAAVGLDTSGEVRGCATQVSGGGVIPDPGPGCEFFASLPSESRLRLRGPVKRNVTVTLQEAQEVAGIPRSVVAQVGPGALYLRRTQFTVDARGAIADCRILEQKGEDWLHVAPKACAPAYRYPAGSGRKKAVVTLTVAVTVNAGPPSDASDADGPTV